MSETLETPGVDEAPETEPREGRVVSQRGRRLLVAIVIILVLALIGITLLLARLVLPSGGVASGDESGGVTWVRSIYGWGDEPTQQFTVPRNANVGPGGTIWVADSTQAIVFGFNPDGLLDQVIGEGASTPLTGPSSIAIGPDDRVFVGESQMDRVRVFGSDGADLGTFAVPSPSDIDYRDGVMSIGSISGLAVVDPETGNPITVVGTRGTGPDQFDTVGGTAIALDGTVYAVDTFNNRLVALTQEGERLWSVQTGNPGNRVEVGEGGSGGVMSDETTGSADLQLPADVTVDNNGRVVVIDSFDFSVAVFSPENGELIAKYGAFGSRDGQFRYPSSISYDPQRDWFVVADTGNARVQIVRIPGSAPFDLGAAARRSLSGPLRACCAPLLLLLVLLIVWLVQRRRRRKQQLVAAAGPAAEPLTETVDS